MESSLRNTAALIGQVNKLEGQLLQRYLSIIDLARLTNACHNTQLPQTNRRKGGEDEPHFPDRNEAAYNTLKMDVETAGLIRAAEDILTLTRQMKELWLFGQLHTLGTGDAEASTEENATAVMEMLGEVLQKLYEPKSGASLLAPAASGQEMVKDEQDM